MYTYIYIYTVDNTHNMLYNTTYVTSVRGGVEHVGGVGVRQVVDAADDILFFFVYISFFSITKY